MFFNFTYNFDLMINEFYSDQKKIMRQDMSLMCSPLYGKNYDFDDTYMKLVNENKNEDRDYMPNLFATENDNWLAWDHFKWRDKFFLVDSLTVDAFQKDAILKNFSTKRLSNYTKKHITKDKPNNRDFSDIKYLLEDYWAFGELSIYNNIFGEQYFDQGGSYSTYNLNRVDDRIIFALLTNIFEIILSFSQVGSVKYLQSYSNHSHLGYNHQEDFPPTTYSSFYSNYLNIYNAIYQIKYFRNMTSELFEALIPIKNKFITNDIFQKSRKINKDFKKSLDKILDFPIKEEFFHTRVANFLTGDDIEQKPNLDEELYLKKLSDFSYKLNIYRALQAKNVSSKNKKKYDQFINEFNEVIISSHTENYEEDEYIDVEFNDRINKYNKIIPKNFAVFIDQISEIKTPMDLLKEMFNSSLNIEESIKQTYDQYSLFAEYATDPERESIFWHSAYLTKDTGIIKKEFETKLEEANLNN